MTDGRAGGSWKLETSTLMIARSLIFIGGIHGVGKSSFCSEIAAALNIQHFSAGELIRRQREVAALPDKRVFDVNGNQNLLVAAIEALSIGEASVLLDGHFCVLNSSEEIVRIPIRTFEQLAPLAVLVISDDIRKIQERLRFRDRKNHSIEILQALQDAELAHANDVCSAIKTTLRRVQPDMLSNAKEFIAQQLASRNL